MNQMETDQLKNHLDNMQCEINAIRKQLKNKRQKKYCLRWIDDQSGSETFLFLDDFNQWALWPDRGQTFSESEIKKLEHDHPRFAPAIEAMKEEVKDDEN